MQILTSFSDAIHCITVTPGMALLAGLAPLSLFLAGAGGYAIARPFRMRLTPLQQDIMTVLKAHPVDAPWVALRTLQQDIPGTQRKDTMIEALAGLQCNGYCDLQIDDGDQLSARSRHK